MKLIDYKRALKGQETLISDYAHNAFARDWRIGAVDALNSALVRAGFSSALLCRHEGTANAVISFCDQKAGR